MKENEVIPREKSNERKEMTKERIQKLTNELYCQIIMEARDKESNIRDIKKE
jgi:hypothetical protein